MGVLHEAIAAHAGVGMRRRIEVPEWSLDGGKTPLVIYYDMVTLDDMANVNDIVKSGALNKIAPYLITLKALDGEGKPIFQMGDASFLKSSAAPDVLQSIAVKMMGRVNQEEARGNLQADPQLMNIFWLADRLKKTPKEIREGFTLEDYDLFAAYLAIVRDKNPGGAR